MQHDKRSLDLGMEQGLTTPGRTPSSGDKPLMSGLFTQEEFILDLFVT